MVPGSVPSVTMLLLLLMLLPSVVPATGDVASQTQALLGLLAPSTPRGEPWPRVPGPAPQDKVCIVGAGPAGVHMALSLKQRNYTRVVVLEKSNRVGGKSHDFEYQGGVYNLGTVFLETNYFKNLVPLAEQYGLGERVKLPPANIWATNSASDVGSKLSPQAFIIGALSKLTNSTSPQVNIGALLKATLAYGKLHKEMFGTIDGDLMQRPSPAVLHRVRGSVLDFLTRERLLPLVPVFTIVFTARGYGYLDETATLYAMTWANPTFVVTVALRALKQEKEPFDVYILKSGFEKLWNTIVEKERLNIVYNVDIVGVHQSQRNSGVLIQKWENSRIEDEMCDFMIWTPPMSELLRVQQHSTRQEHRLFSSQSDLTYTASVVDGVGEVLHGPYTTFMANVNSKEENRVTALVDTAGIRDNPDISTSEGLETYNNLGGRRTTTCFQMAQNKTTEADVNHKLKDHFEQGFNMTDTDILFTESWSYFPRWGPEQMAEAPHWEVFAMQGRARVWYAGSSVSFESVRSVMEYNNLLLRQMEPGPEIGMGPKKWPKVHRTGPFTVWNRG